MNRERESSKYLKWIPVKFSCQLGLGFLILLAIFRLIESRAASFTAIHGTLPVYMFMLVLLPCISGLAAMLATYLEMRLAETRLIKYLEQQNILAY